MESIRSLVANKDNVHLILRGTEFVLSAVAFFTVTSVTGLPSADYAFIVAYTTTIYAAFHYFLVIRFKKLEIRPEIELGIEAVLCILLLIAGIAVAASSSAFATCRLLGKCGATYLAVICLFVVCFIQAFFAYLTFMEHILPSYVDRNAAHDIENPVVETPVTEYVAPIQSPATTKL